MCQNIKLYTLNVCSLSYVNFTSRKLFPEKKKKKISDHPDGCIKPVSDYLEDSSSSMSQFAFTFTHS